MVESNVCMKLLINSQTNQVLFAEAGKDCVDFLFHILSLPIATVIRLLREQGMVGSLGNLYESVENLDGTYIQPDQNKDSLLKPKVSSVPLLLLESGSGNTTGKLFYKCPNHSYGSCPYYSDGNNALCPSHSCTMNNRMTYVAPPGVVEKGIGKGGFVKGVVTYLVMDDLIIKPMSTISSLTLLNTFNVKEIGALKEKEVYISMKEAVKLLKTSLHSKNVMTEVAEEAAELPKNEVVMVMEAIAMFSLFLVGWLSQWKKSG